MSAGELLDVLDDSGAATGESKLRDHVHRDGDWHRVFHLWIVRSSGNLLMQRRARHKRIEPNKVDVTVGGHLVAGESVFNAVREVEEEIGLEVRPERLSCLGTWRSERHYPGWVDREFQETYVLLDDRPLEEFFLDCREVYVLYDVPLERAVELYRDGTPLPAPGFDCRQRVNDALLISDDLISEARPVVLEQLESALRWLEAADGGSAPNASATN